MEGGVNVLKLILLACLFNQIYCYTSRYAGPNVARTLRCNNGQYVADSDLCDDIQDCTDGSDEPNSCKTSWNCGPGQFSCVPYSNSTTNATLTAKCLNAKVLCDTRKDCANNFDEENCGDATSVQNCQLGDGKFLCRDKLRCLGIENTCDGSCNCLDFSDENENCTKIDYQSLNKCPHAYYPLPLSSGPICFCNSSNSALQNLCKATSVDSTPNTAAGSPSISAAKNVDSLPHSLVQHSSVKAVCSQQMYGKNWAGKEMVPLYDGSMFTALSEFETSRSVVQPSRLILSDESLLGFLMLPN